VSNVYLVQEPLKRDPDVTIVPKINYRTLKPYGDVRFLFQWDELKDDDTLNPHAMLERLRDLLCDFTDDDYIVPIGNPALIGMAVLIAAECNDGRVRMLDWIKAERRYRIVDVDLGWDD
jgi:hypothetical protein